MTLNCRSPILYGRAGKLSAGEWRPVTHCPAQPAVGPWLAWAAWCHVMPLPPGAGIKKKRIYEIELRERPGSLPPGVAPSLRLGKGWWGRNWYLRRVVL